VECALKACICGNTRAFDFPPRNASDYWVHDLEKLLKGAGLEPDLERDRGEDKRLAAYWYVVRDWKEDRRYRYNGNDGERAAQELLQAISDPEHGVLQWLLRYAGKT
jgi:hypothetical protein